MSLQGIWSYIKDINQHIRLKGEHSLIFVFRNKKCFNTLLRHLELLKRKRGGGYTLWPSDCSEQEKCLYCWRIGELSTFMYYTESDDFNEQHVVLHFSCVGAAVEFNTFCKIS